MTQAEQDPDCTARVAGDRIAAAAPPADVIAGAPGGAVTAPSAGYAGLDARLSAAEAAIEHLEAAFEGLQDAVHRRSRLDDQRIDELLRRTTYIPGGEPARDGRDEAP